MHYQLDAVVPISNGSGNLIETGGSSSSVPASMILIMQYRPDVITIIESYENGSGDLKIKIG